MIHKDTGGTIAFVNRTERLPGARPGRRLATVRSPGFSPPAGHLPSTTEAERQRAIVLSTLLVDLLAQIVLVADLVDLVELSFNPVHMFLFIHNDMLQKLPAGVICCL